MFRDQTRSPRPGCTRLAHPLLAMFLATLLAVTAGCGGSSEDLSTTPGEPPEPQPPACESGPSYAGTFDAVQDIVFEQGGCTTEVCHGDASAGGLDLRADAAWQNLVDAPSAGSELLRVRPGDKTRSLLWHKLAAATAPDVTDYQGAPMPTGRAPISADALELIRWWIYGGAPETGTVAGTEDLVGGCLPPTEPQPIRPLAAPEPGEGIQLVVPEFEIPAGSELEYCFATWYDISDQVPAEFLDPSGENFYLGGRELRMDAQSHHIILNLASVEPEELGDPAFGAWQCRGGERAGAACEPTLAGDCGDGICASEPQPSFACIGFGPRAGNTAFRTFRPIGGAQQPVAVDDYPEGVYAMLPVRGVLYWNPHAFNLSTVDTTLHGRFNYYFAEHRTWPVRGIFDTSKIFAANAAPFTKQTICNDHVLPRGARLFQLNSHTHKFGERFTVELPDGSLLYESFTYNDPVDLLLDPPLEFDSRSADERTLRYCADYNNGVDDDGSPDPSRVTRLSRMPDPSLGAGALIEATCTPEACTAGNIGAPCGGADDHTSCDSAPGAGDGECDACPITGGETTETEMFILLGSYYVLPPADLPVGEIMIRLSRMRRTSGRGGVTGGTRPFSAAPEVVATENLGGA